MYTYNGKHYTPEMVQGAADKAGIELAEYLKKHGIQMAKAKKTMYYTQDGTPYNVSEDQLDAFKQKLPEARTMEEWEKAQKDYEKSKKGSRRKS